MKNIINIIVKDEENGSRIDSFISKKEKMLSRTRIKNLILQKNLKLNDALDFDDLLTFPLDIFEKKPAVLKKYQKRWKYILVDEYQDTNRAQFQFLTNLAKSHENICVVGDDDQSIYGWRGADVSNILDFNSFLTFSSIAKSSIIIDLEKGSVKE